MPHFNNFHRSVNKSTKSVLLLIYIYTDKFEKIQKSCKTSEDYINSKRTC